MTEVYLALGSNVGDSRGYIKRAIELLGTKLVNLKQAPLYRSKAVGYTDQPDFLNTAISGQTNLDSTQLFNFVKETEQQVGRVARFRWGPREIDIDIIFYGDQIIKTNQLTIPHPRFAKRDFVLRPLAYLNPVFEDPISHKTVQQLLDQLSPDDLSVQSSD